MSDESTHNLKVGDPVRLKDSDQRLRGDVWQLRTGRYVVVRWEDRARTTHSESAIELDVHRDGGHRDGGHRDSELTEDEKK